MYTLKNIRRIRGLEGSGVTASIYCGDLRVGWVQVPADGGNTLFTFDVEGERTGLEQYVETWWQTAQSRIAFELITVEFASSNPEFVPRLHAKLKYWVMSLVREANAEKKLKTAA